MDRQSRTIKRGCYGVPLRHYFDFNLSIYVTFMVFGMVFIWYLSAFYMFFVTFHLLFPPSRLFLTLYFKCSLIFFNVDILITFIYRLSHIHSMGFDISMLISVFGRSWIIGVFAVDFLWILFNILLDICGTVAFYGVNNATCQIAMHHAIREMIYHNISEVKITP